MNDSETIERLVNEAVAAGVHWTAARRHRVTALTISEGKGSVAAAALLGVWSAAKEWDKGKGPWLAWAQGAAKKGIHDANKVHKRAVGKAASLDSMVTDPETGVVSGPSGTVTGSFPDHAVAVAGREVLSSRVDRVLDRVGRDNNKGWIFVLLFLKYKPADIARVLEISRQNVMDDIRDLRPLVAEVFEE